MPEPLTVSPALDTGLYTLTPTHCGTGQAAGAVDLPIARERHTGFPLVPSTSLKGVVRELVEGHRGGDPWDSKHRQELLGTDPPGEHGSDERIQAGQLVLTDARLLAFPVRSLQAPFLWVTCPLVVGRWERDRRALGIAVPELAGALANGLPLAAGPPLGDGGLVLEDHYFQRVNWQHGGMTDLARRWGTLLPRADAATRNGLASKLVAIPDDSFQDLVRRTTPVHARIQLTGGKTTDTWRNPTTGLDETGNLWYEETLPSDCLFSVLATSRRRRRDDALALARLLTDPAHAVVQVGGNETVGQGLCWWTPEEDADGR